MGIDEHRRVPGDWFDGRVPANIAVHREAFIESSYSFRLFHSRRENAGSFGRGCSMYLGTMLDVGERGCLRVGEFAILNGPRLICDVEIEIGDFALVAWQVILMDSYRLPFDPLARREVIRQAHVRPNTAPAARDPVARPIRIGRNVWIGFDSCILPGVTIGEGSVVGARSTVVADVPPFTIVAGSPARVIRSIAQEGNP